MLLVLLLLTHLASLSVQLPLNSQITRQKQAMEQLANLRACPEDAIMAGLSRLEAAELVARSSFKG